MPNVSDHDPGGKLMILTSKAVSAHMVISAFRDDGKVGSSS